MSIADKYTTLTEKIPQVYEAGKNAEHLKFWSDLTSDYTRTSYQYGFSGYSWNEKTFNPPVALSPVNARSTFYVSRVTTITDSQIDFSNATDMRNAFQSASLLKTLILKIGEKSRSYNTETFDGCTALENLTIIGTILNSGINLGDSTKLTMDSIASVFNALSTTTSGLSITLSKTAVNNAFSINIDDETTYPQDSPYYNLRHSRDNWTINYV